MRYKLLTEQELAAWIKKSVGTLRNERSKPGKDPIPYTKIGGQVRYREELVLKWIQRNTFNSTEEEQEVRAG